MTREHGRVDKGKVDKGSASHGDDLDMDNGNQRRPGPVGCHSKTVLPANAGIQVVPPIVFQMVTTQVLPFFSFPFKGKAGKGMGSLRCHTLLPHPHPNPPLEGEGIAVVVLRLSLRPE